MLAIKGVYDGKHFIPLEKFQSTKRFNVIITILDEEVETENAQVRNFSSNSNSFEFWNNDQENLYQEYVK